MKNKIWYILITFMVILCSYSFVFASSVCVHVFIFSKMECERCGEALTLNAGIDGRAAVANGPRLIENKPYSANFMFNNKIDIKNRIECKILDEKGKVIFNEIAKENNIKEVSSNMGKLYLYEFNVQDVLAGYKGEITLILNINKKEISRIEYYLYHRHIYDSTTFLCECGEKFKYKNIKLDDMDITNEKTIYMNQINGWLSVDVTGVSPYMDNTNSEYEKDIEILFRDVNTQKVVNELFAPVIFSAYNPENENPEKDLTYDFFVDYIAFGNYDIEFYFYDNLIETKRLCVGTEFEKEDEEYIPTKQTFYDVDKNYWAYVLIEEMVENKILAGYPDGSFRPDAGITRAEAAKIFMLSLAESSVFPYSISVTSDVMATHWASRYIINGKLYIKLYEDGTFKPEQYITRLEFVNAVSENLERAMANEKFDNIVFSDINDLDAESIEAIYHLCSLGIINGYEDGTFRPNDTLTRAEVCKIISEALKYRTEKYVADVKNTRGWQQFDQETGWHSAVRIDEKGRIKQFATMNRNPVQLYYDGKFIVEAPNVDTVLEEKITTYDGKEWTIRWTGSDVVEYSQNEEGKWIIIDHYNEKEKIFDEYYVSTKVAKETCEEFTGMECWYDVSEEYGKLFFYYINGTIGSGSSSVLEAIKDSNGEWFVSIKSLNSDIWMHVVNH